MKPMAYVIKTEVRDASADTFIFQAEKTMYGGKQIAAGDPLFIIASENQGGKGLCAKGIVAAVEAVAKTRPDAREAPRVSVTVTGLTLVKRQLGRPQLKPFTNWQDGQPATELNFKLYRQATNKIVGVSEKTADFLEEFF